MGAPGVAPAPGMQPQSQQHRGFPPNFQPPANMPDINFAAPVIRLGTSGPGKPDQGPREERRGANNEPLGNRRGMGLGYDRDQQRSHLRENMMALQAPTREEIARTIFVGNIVDAFGGDESLSQILNAAGGLRRWIRVIDADNKPCNYGFAEYEDADSLAMASEVLKDVPVPGKQPQTNGVKSESNGIKSEDEDETKPKAENGEDSEMKDEGADIKKEEGGHESTSTDKLLVSVKSGCWKNASADCNIRSLSTKLHRSTLKIGVAKDPSRTQRKPTSESIQLKMSCKTSWPASHVPKYLSRVMLSLGEPTRMVIHLWESRRPIPSPGRW